MSVPPQSPQLQRGEHFLISIFQVRRLRLLALQNPVKGNPANVGQSQVLDQGPHR